MQRQGASGAAEENEMFGFLGLSPLLIAAVVAVIAAIVVVVATDDQASPA